MATKKTKYFAKAVLIDNGTAYKVGDEIKLTDAQAKRLLDAGVVSESADDAESADPANEGSDK